MYLRAVSIAELLKMKDCRIKQVDEDRHDQHKQKHVTDLRKLELNDRAHVK